jgi:hypothetical protein
MPYKDELKKEIFKVLQQFHDEEKGSRVTTFNMCGLIEALTMVFEKYEIKQKEIENA